MIRGRSIAYQTLPSYRAVRPMVFACPHPSLWSGYPTHIHRMYVCVLSGELLVFNMVWGIVSMALCFSKKWFLTHSSSRFRPRADLWMYRCHNCEAFFTYCFKIRATTKVSTCFPLKNDKRNEFLYLCRGAMSVSASVVYMDGDTSFAGNIADFQGGE